MPNKTQDPYGFLELLLGNQNKNFVQRILNAQDYPSQTHPDRTTSSHLMASGEAEGKHIAFPTLVQDRHSQQLFSPKNPIKYAMENNEFLEFDNQKTAELFAKDGYKEYFDYKSAEPQQESELFIKILLNLFDGGF